MLSVSLLGYEEALQSLETWGDFPDMKEAADRENDLVLLLKSTVLRMSDISTALVQLNRRLKFGGLRVANVAEGRGDEMAHPLESYAGGIRVLGACGFRVEVSVTGVLPFLEGISESPDNADTEPQRCWRAVKVSERLR